MKTAYKFRMYPNKQQEAMLDVTLETCRHLYNTALADRKNCYELEGVGRSYEDQAATYFFNINTSPKPLNTCNPFCNIKNHTWRFI